MAGNGQHGWKWRDMAGNGWEKLEMAGMGDMAGKCWKWLEMTGNEWDGGEMLEMAENSCTYLEMAGIAGYE